MYTKADNFGISFPMDLAVRVKATLLGAVFLIVSFNSFIHRQILKHRFVSRILCTSKAPLEPRDNSPKFM